MLTQGIIDFHTHAFADAIAGRAMEKLQARCSVQAVLDGTIGALLDSMDKSGIEKSIICNIATKPSQFEPLIGWCSQIRSERIVPLPSVHPDDGQFAEKIHIVKDQGYKGIKMHPYYQDFYIDEPKAMRIYEQLCKENLLILMHTGFDIGFERIRRADPPRLAKVMDELPELKFIASHLGGWEDWDQVRQLLIGKNIYIEVSLSMEFMDKASVLEMLRNHPKEYLLFGTDSPWASQAAALELLRGIGLDDEREQMMLRTNAMRLLEAVG